MEGIFFSVAITTPSAAVRVEQKAIEKEWKQDQKSSHKLAHACTHKLKGWEKNSSEAVAALYKGCFFQR
jgi:hypothetical protein